MTDRSNQSFRFALGPLPDLLIVDSAPDAGVRISVDGSPVGVTPLEPIELNAGEHEVSADAERYRPFSQPVSAPGGGTSIELVVTMEPLWADIAIRSDPPGAKLSLDGDEGRCHAVDGRDARRAAPVRVEPRRLQKVRGNDRSRGRRESRGRPDRPRTVGRHSAAFRATPPARPCW